MSKRIEDDKDSTLRNSPRFLTLATALAPGLGLLLARRRIVGSIFLFASTPLYVLLLVVLMDREQALSWILSIQKLDFLVAGSIFYAVLFPLSIVITITSFDETLLAKSWDRLWNVLTAAALSFALSSPFLTVANSLSIEKNALQSVFKDNSRSQTAPTRSDSSSLLGETGRVNILMVGVDDAASRKYTKKAEENTDTIIVASINTKNGKTTLIQVPRNLQYARFPAGTKLAEQYPEGWRGSGDAESSMINQIWAGAPSEHPELFTDTDFPKADALKLAVQGTLGIPISYFVSINLDGMNAFLDAIGGVTVNVNYPYAIGGDTRKGPSSVHGYLKVGPNQHLQGDEAMWYARSRYNDPQGDFGRMARQSCLIKAISKQVSPEIIVTKFESIMNASSAMIKTDIPQKLVPDLVSLGLKAKNLEIDKLQFVNGKDGFVSANPNIALMQSRVKQVLDFSKSTTSGSETSTNQSRPRPSSSATQSNKGTGITVTPPASTTPASDGAIGKMEDPCAFNPIPIVKK